eukprot:gene12591-biopygen19681
MLPSRRCSHQGDAATKVMPPSRRGHASIKAMPLSRSCLYQDHASIKAMLPTIRPAGRRPPAAPLRRRAPRPQRAVEDQDKRRGARGSRGSGAPPQLPAPPPPPHQLPGRLAVRENGGAAHRGDECDRGVAAGVECVVDCRQLRAGAVLGAEGTRLQSGGRAGGSVLPKLRQGPRRRGLLPSSNRRAPGLAAHAARALPATHPGCSVVVGDDGSAAARFSPDGKAPCGGDKAKTGSAATRVGASLSLRLDSAPPGGEATVTLSGPADAWFGVGLAAGQMTDQPYTLIANASGVLEQKIGTCGSEARGAARARR